MSDLLRLLIGRYLLDVELLTRVLRESLPTLREYGAGQSEPRLRDESKRLLDRLDEILTRVEALTGGLEPAIAPARPRVPEATSSKPKTAESSCVCACGESLVPESLQGMPLYHEEDGLRVYKAKCLSCGRTGEVRRRGPFPAPPEHPCTAPGAVAAALAFLEALPRLADGFLVLRHPGTRNGHWRLAGDYSLIQDAERRLRKLNVRQGGAVVFDTTRRAIMAKSFAPMLRTRW
jgi:hypothetical protein